MKAETLEGRGKVPPRVGDEIQRLSFTLTHLLKHILKFHRLLPREFDLFEFTLAMLCNLAGPPFIGHHNGVVTRIRHTANP